MGANLPCSATSDCCNKEHQDIHVFRAKDPGERLPGLRLDLPVAVEQSMSAKETPDPASGPEARAEPRANSRDSANRAPAPTSPSRDNDNDNESQDFFLLPRADSRSDDDPVIVAEPEDADAGQREADAGRQDLIGSRATEKGYKSVSQVLKAMDKDAGAGRQELPKAKEGGPATPREEAANEAGPATPRAEAPANPEELRPSAALEVESQGPPASRFREKVESSGRGAGPEDVGEGGKLVLEFRLPDGSMRHIDFGNRRPPMGLDFAKDTPIPVHYVKPGGHAAELGVQTGWVVTCINGNSLEGLPFKEAMLLMTNAATKAQRSARTPNVDASASGPQPPPPSIPMPVPARSARTPELPSGGAAGEAGNLVVGFLLPDGSRRVVDFGSRKPPLGMDFDKSIPITVKKIKPGLHAEELGILSGWQITHINDDSVEGKTAVEVFNMMKLATSSRA